MDLCANVILTPEHNKIIVLNRGKLQVSKHWIPFGGQIYPIPIDIAKQECNKAQKNATKNQNSETMNNTMLVCIFFCTFLVWKPSNVDSIIISVNHLLIKIKKNISDISILKNSKW